MFENRQDQVQALLKENFDFRRIYDKHQELEKQVLDAEAGTLPMDDITLHQIKKEKLLFKDHLAQYLA